MLATEIARDDGVMACEMRLAVLAAEDFVRVEVGVVDEAHARRRERERERECAGVFSTGPAAGTARYVFSFGLGK